MTRRFYIFKFSVAILGSFILITSLVFYNKAVISQDTQSYLYLAIVSLTSVVSFKGMFAIAVFTALIFVCLIHKKNTFNFIFKYRFLFCAVLFCVLVVFGVNGSSIGIWDSENNTTLAGIIRGIRGDEYNVLTPLALSQYSDSSGLFQYFSNVVRGCSTDVFLEYGAPVFDIVEIFRPFHWGYLFLPPAMGLSFFWYGRLITLFIVSFEMGRFLTKDKRNLAIAYACLITFAPTVQWWFAVNGVVEIFVYAQVATLAFKEFLTSNGKLLKRIFCISLICICAFGYVLVFYPPWQIPIAYVILTLEICVLIMYRKQTKFNIKEIISCLICVLIFLLVFSRVIFMSKDTISSILNTAYPGIRDFHGGGNIYDLFKYVANIFYPINLNNFLGRNVCEEAFFIDFFPLPIILSLVIMFKKRLKDPLMIGLLFIVVFLDVYAIFGLPVFIEKITLLNMCQPHRLVQVSGFANIMLLIRSLSMLKTNQKLITIFVSVGFAFFAVVLCRDALPGYLTLKWTIISCFIFACASYFLLNHSKYKVLGSLFLILMMLFTGGLVNPVQVGLNSVYENSTYKLVKSVHDKDVSALWACEGSEIPANLLITAGAPTVNSINIYPNLERWESLDVNRNNEEIYNRYAHIIVKLKKQGDTEFSLNAPDSFTVTMTPQEAKKIGIKYICTKNNLSQSLDSSSISLIEQTNDVFVYEIM